MERMVKEYFSVDEAAQRLSTPNENLSRRDVLDLAMRGKLRLVFWHEGELHRFRCVLGGGYADLSEDDAEGWHVSAAGYFLVPRWQITPVSSGFTIDDIRPVEKPACSSRPWRTGARGYVLGAYSLENEERITHRPIHVDADSVLVPFADIEALGKKQIAGMTGPAANAAHCEPAGDEPAPAQPATDLSHQDEAKTATNEPQDKADSASPAERTRTDDIGIEVDEVIASLERQGERITATTLMPLLRTRAGRPDSCISEVAGDGVIWIRTSTGKPEKLTISALKERIRRRAKAR